ncbi:unnamed protein product [Prorocentrum cordatum]|uniref:Uncharacterized protein n=1 Tax=Prorocentrum cordatum TaxID=2364126 RepID=A0ABN9XWJ2_9DINO|nr:unnamed protein product [Polarella glacialis]
MPTDAFGILLAVEGAIQQRERGNSGLVIIQTVLKNCFGHVCPHLVDVLALRLGMNAECSRFLFLSNVSRPMFVRPSGDVPPRGECHREIQRHQQLAPYWRGLHARYMFHHHPYLPFHTYVDDPTLLGKTWAQVAAASWTGFPGSGRTRTRRPSRPSRWVTFLMG